MQEIMLNDIFHLSEKEIQNSKIELNMKAGSGGQSFLERWLKHNKKDKEDGTCTDCSYWGWYGKQRNFYPKEYAFSFIRMAGNEWLFISAAEILSVPENDRAIVRILEQYKPFFGKLIIRCNKGNTFSRYVFKLNGFINNCSVKEILPCIYSGETFEGYDNVNLPYYRLNNMFSGEIMPTYYEALKKVKGVYCLTDKKTGLLYIGSATGEEGVAQRWGNYLESKHGGNKKLIALRNEKGDKYFEEHFTYTLLEFFTLSYDDEKILERERYWKRCFDTVEHGYNDNY